MTDHLKLLKNLEDKISHIEHIQLKEQSLQVKYELMHMNEKLADLEECIKEKCQEFEGYKEKIIEIRTKLDIVLEEKKEKKTSGRVNTYLSFFSKHKTGIMISCVALSVVSICFLMFCDIITFKDIKDLIGIIYSG